VQQRSVVWQAVTVSRPNPLPVRYLSILESFLKNTFSYGEKQSDARTHTLKRWKGDSVSE